MAVSSANGYHFGPPRPGPIHDIDSYENIPKATHRPRAPYSLTERGACFQFIQHGACHKKGCIYDHSRGAHIRHINLTGKLPPSGPRYKPPPPTSIQSQHQSHNAQRDYTQAPQHAPPSARMDAPPYSPHYHEPPHYSPQTPPNIQKHLPNDPGYYQEHHHPQPPPSRLPSAESSFNHPPRFLPGQGQHQGGSYQQQAMGYHGANIQRSSPQTSVQSSMTYNHGSQYNEDRNPRQGGHSHQWNQPGFTGREHGMYHRKSAHNYVKRQFPHDMYRGLPGDPRERNNYRGDRSPQYSMDGRTSQMHWTPRSPTSASVSSRVSQESHNLIDLSHDLLGEDLPESAGALATITATSSREQLAANDLQQLIPVFSEESSLPVGSSASSGQDNLINDFSSLTNGSLPTTNGNLENVTPANPPSTASAPRNMSVLEPVLAQLANTSSTPASTPVFPSVDPRIAAATEALQKLLPLELSKVLEQAMAGNLNFTPKLDAENTTKQPEIAKTDDSEANNAESVVGDFAANATSSSTGVPEPSVDSDDISYPSSVFSSPPSSPRYTTIYPCEVASFKPQPLPFQTEISFEEFKRRNICVSSNCYERVDNFGEAMLFPIREDKPAISSNNGPSTPTRQTESSRAQSPIPLHPTTEDDILGPRPKPSRWSHANSRSPSPTPDSDEPQPLVRITRQHVFDITYCWNCWSQMHKASDCLDPHRNNDEREQLRIQKRVISKSWTREMESLGRQVAFISIPGVSDEEAYRLQAAVPLRNKKKITRHPSPTTSFFEDAPGGLIDESDWWNNTPPIPDISEAEVALWANMTATSTTSHEGTYIEHPWSDISMESGAETTVSTEPTEAHMDGDSIHSNLNCRSVTESEDEAECTILSATEPQGASTVDMEDMVGDMVVDMVGGMVVDMEEDMVEGDMEEEDMVEDIHSLSESSPSGDESENENNAENAQNNVEDNSGGSEEGFNIERSTMRIREPRPEELQEPRLIFVGSNSTRRRRKRNAAPENTEERHPRLSRMTYKDRRKLLLYWAQRGMNKLPTEVLSQIVGYVGRENLDDDPENEGTVHERAKAERTRALNLMSLRFVNKTFYSVVQKMIYTRISITAVPDLERLVGVLASRDRLANLVLDLTIDINQIRKADNWRDYGKPTTFYKSRETTPKMTIGTTYLIRYILVIFENCRFLSRFAFHCTGAAQAFLRLDGEYTSIRKLNICDLLEVGKCGELFWRNVQRCPNLEELSLLRPDENRDLDMRPIQISPSGRLWATHGFPNLQLLKFTNAAEISDKVLLSILPNLPKLSRIILYECKLVTSSGIAHVITEIQDRLTEFVYCDFVDCNGRTSEEEQKSKRTHHLCHALAGCSKLRELSLSAYRCCPDLFTLANWPYLQNLKIEMMFYTGCDGEEDDTVFRESLVQAHMEGRVPSLHRQNVQYQTNTPGIIYRRQKVFTDEELARASGYI